MPYKTIYMLGAVLVAVLLVCGSAAFAGSADIQWYSYENGIRQIKKSDKKGYLHFYTDWCAYCKMMKQKTFTDQKVVSYLNANFIPIRVNADQEPAIAKQYGADRFPFNWFLNKETEPIGGKPGFIPPGTMLQILRYIGTDDYRKMGFDEFIEKQEP